MLQSMTGYGTATRETDQYSLVVEAKSLNSKGLDLSLRLPRFLNDRELEIRNMATRALGRGKINLSIDFSRPRTTTSVQFVLNQEALVAAYQELARAAELVGAPKDDLFGLALKMPGVIQSPTEAARPEENEALSWEELQPVLQEALDKLNQFRQDEGQTLTTEILSYIDRIRILLADVDRHDPVRVETIREKLRAHLADLSTAEQFNANRFEQELLYYIEKLDIAEEKVRLISHLHYFNETVFLPEPTGKKLAFISQEIGREINTIGSKANDPVIQHLVVEMKEELEKIKEQINNIL
ncbi:YicC/YloC family endoribonuclease [Hymenobacter sp. BT730]|uniref:YicC/YloC family endoribonuclease n=1 Tax=Hymenobacter sp. BT730 TaxID=3063332 RepID=UPI0026DFBD5B|nr:YicC/YloC family endoribonuclease [Hymenobacter sp. BT730]